MKTKQIKLRVPEPCHEDWNKMTPKDQGAFCQSCAKVVVDFTKMSDREVIKFLAKNKDEKTCGKFNAYQLERKIVATDPSPNYLQQMKRYFTGLFFALGFSSFIQAEEAPLSNSKFKTIIFDDASIGEKILIKGIVRNVYGDTIKGASIRVYQNGRITEQFVKSDSNGSFALEITKSSFDKELSLKIEVKGFKDKIVALVNDEPLNIYLDFAVKQNTQILGKMAVVQVNSPSNGESSEVIQQEPLDKMGEVVAIEEAQFENTSEHIELMGDVIIEEEEPAAFLDIQGKVVDENGEALPFVNVFVKHTGLGVTTDYDGFFRLSIPPALQKEVSPLILKVQYIGYETLEYEIDSEELVLELVMYKPIDEIIVGMIIHVPIEEKSPSSFDANYQEPDWKEKGFNSKKEYLQHMKMNKKLKP